MEYHGAFTFDIKNDPVHSVAERRILPVASLSDTLTDRFSEFSDETSKFQ